MKIAAHSHGRLRPISLFIALFALTACGSDEPPPQQQPQTCDLAQDTGCQTGQVCEEVAGGQPACFQPVTIQGTVKSTTGTPIEKAQVVARDANGAAVSTVAETKADGTYSVAVPTTRNADGTSATQTQYTLRADAAGYLTFPSPPREALPVDTKTAIGNPPIVKSTATDIALIALASTTGTGTISGKVGGDAPGGTLVVANGVTAVADRDGNFTIFNVPAGSVEVKGYKTGNEVSMATVTVTAGQTAANVSLQNTGAATATVSGKVEIVNPGDGSATSVILVVEETFDETVIHGEAPPGLRAANVTGDWSIAGVPSGKYVVLAAFENDWLVRDPDTTIGGTQIQHITVAGAPVTVEGFKVTGALDVVSPGANGAEAVTGNPTLTWADDSSEDHYEVRVFDALGNKVWEDLAVPGVSGPKEVTAAYAGPPLTPGMYYQFKAVSIGKAGEPISTTEDLKGVFYAQ